MLFFLQHKREYMTMSISPWLTLSLFNIIIYIQTAANGHAELESTTIEILRVCQKSSLKNPLVI